MYSKVLSVKGHLFLKMDLTFVAFSARHHLAKHLEVAHAKKKGSAYIISHLHLPAHKSHSAVCWASRNVAGLTVLFLKEPWWCFPIQALFCWSSNGFAGKYLGEEVSISCLQIRIQRPDLIGRVTMGRQR